MIAASTGEVSFSDGVFIKPHSLLAELLANVSKSLLPKSRALPVEGWAQHSLGVHQSDLGLFEVEVVSGNENRVEGIFLSHSHSFYEGSPPGDEERRVFHEGIISSDLRGQSEFSWGHVFCKLDREAGRNWLVVIYNPFANVPMPLREVYQQFFARETPPGC